MHYARSWRFIFDSPHWLTNLLLMVLCGFVPVLGPLVMLGYHYAVVQSLHLSRDARYEDFNFDRLMAYLMRGVWPFLLHLIVIFPLMLTMLLIWGIGAGLAAALVTETNAAVVVPLLIGAAMIVYLATLFVALLIVVPMELRFGLAQEFALGAAWEFGSDFRRRVGRELAWSLVYNFLMGPLVLFAGALVCCVGMYPANEWLLLSHYHRVGQLYQLYLERGGTEVPLRVEAA
ncbi:MAG: DUF4013 domain-containing protein [Planctomycetia bacterium]|nr:DUF4013 domain-containing protein [Planctomycetia bacterium]